MQIEMSIRKMKIKVHVFFAQRLRESAIFSDAILLDRGRNYDDAIDMLANVRNIQRRCWAWNAVFIFALKCLTLHSMHFGMNVDVDQAGLCQAGR